MKQNKVLELKLFSSLEKVFADEEPAHVQTYKGSMLSNEVYSFQIAYRWNSAMLKDAGIRVVSELTDWITVRTVGLVPSEMPCYADHDDNVLRVTPGLYPDSLMPITDEGIILLPEQWRSLWVTVDPKGACKPGNYPIRIIFDDPQGIELGTAEFNLELIGAALPQQTLIRTEWFHADCLSNFYGVDVFSEEHWEIIEKFVKTASDYGINMILTPVFTPPLDTMIGGERPTVQLTDVEKVGDRYEFGFDRLKRWIDMCLKAGIQYFEFSHLFTQWGAKHAPKIMARENGELKRIFGWETDAASAEYSSFLDQFLKALVSFIKQNHLEKQSYFHVSDEPLLEHMEAYKNAADIINRNLKGFPVIDALSDYTYYEKGIVKNPIPSTDHIDKFLEHQVPDLWTYYCCGQYKKVSNRFFAMPSARNRIIGYQLYKYNIKGFLQWGYNFWYTRHSKSQVNPFYVSDAGYSFPSGDAYVVYPGKDGPVVSLRLEVFRDALQDMRAFTLLESFIGRKAVIELVEEGLDTPVTFCDYPRDAQWLLSMRERVNRKIESNVFSR